MILSGRASDRTWLTAAVTLACVAAVPLSGCGKTGRAADESSGTAGDRPVLLSAPGRVEGATEVIAAGAAMDGVIAEVPVRDGQQVEKGDELARLVCDELKAVLAATRGDESAARQSRRRLVRGSRVEERRGAAAETAVARASLERARWRHDRLTQLASEGEFVSEDDVDAARRDLAVSEAELVGAEEHERLVNAPPLPEEIARADAEVQAAAGRVRAAVARVENCVVKAPLDGTVVRRHLNPGEQVSLALPRPVVSVADLSSLRVRAEVDERDVGRIRVGQAVLIEANALGNDSVRGHVIRLGSMMGRKTVRTGDPAEKSDRDVLEVLVDLETADPRLVVDLRVTVLFLAPGMGDESR